MGKTKSAICLTLITLIIAVLIVVCYASFPCGEINYYNSFLSLTDKDADLGEYLIGDTAYVGGGYEVVYYPEGVISSREYEETAADKTGDDLTDYQNKYVAYANGAIYLEKDAVCEDGKETVSESFRERFANNVNVLKERYEQLHVEGTSLRVCDDYTVRVFLPSTSDASAAAFRYYSYTGEFSLKFGSDESSATPVIPAQRGTKHAADYYVKDASVKSSGGTYYVAIRFTDEGRAAVAEATADATGSFYFSVGDNSVINLTVDAQIDQQTLYISGSYTSETATVVAALIDSAVKSGSQNDLAMEMSDLSRIYAGFGDSALLYIYIALGACMAAMLLFFLIRYRRLAFAHIYSFLIFTLAMTLCFWAVPGLTIGVGTVSAFAITALLLCASNAISYEYARKEYANGKTMTFSVKTGYRKCMWHIFDLHIALFIVSLLTYLIALTELSVFALALTLGVVFSGVCSLLINRFCWYIMMPFAKNQGQFCHFKRAEEVDDDE